MAAISGAKSEGSQPPSRELSLLDDDSVVPATPQPNDIAAIPCSQETIPSTQDPGSPARSEPSASPPLDPNTSFKTESNDDRNPEALLTSSLTPPPSQQVTRHVSGNTFFRPQGVEDFTPPVTGHHVACRDDPPTSDYMPPSPSQVVSAAPEDLRAMLHACITEHSRLKMEAAHHKLQFNLLTMQAEEEASRAAIENEITRREVEILQQAEQSRQAKSEMALAHESAQLELYRLRTWVEEVVAENENYRDRLKSAKKVIQKKQDEIIALTDERDLLLTRIRENREHFNMLCSPGGIFHSAVPPRATSLSTTQQATRGSRRHVNASSRNDNEHREERLNALLQVLHQENSSAPSTPLTASRPALRNTSKHTRAVQSLSSLPTTPTTRTHNHGSLLPSIDLVPRTEPPRRSAGGFPMVTPTRGTHSRESTISAEDNEELARQAVEAAAQSFSLSRRGQCDEDEVYESQASRTASQMLRSDTRESFNVGSSVHSREPTPAPAEKTVKLQARLYGGVNKMAPGSSKRQFNGGIDHREDITNGRAMVPSPSKRARIGTDGRRIGLGIQYGQDA